MVRIAVTGLNATDNPAAGVGVLRSLGEDPHNYLVGLAYDALDPGVYATALVNDVFLLPYPSSRLESFLARIEYVHQTVGLDVIVPTLDAELPAFIAIQPKLRAMGIATFLPTREQFEVRTKAKLAELGRRAEISVPRSVSVSNPEEVARAHERIEFPFFVKGVFYGATLVTCLEEALPAFHRAAAKWGLPVILQQCVYGEELNVVALGDGTGRLVGAVPMRKLLLTDKGKGWAGITIRDAQLLTLAERFVHASRWRGPCELEVIRNREGQYHLLEVNPRFPAWVHLATAAGMNLPRAAVDLALGRPAPPSGDYAVGKMFVRISVDQVASITDFERILTGGEIRRDKRASDLTGSVRP
jgi:carbamoyl-phosphate synthase large subunit